MKESVARSIRPESAGKEDDVLKAFDDQLRDGLAFSDVVKRSSRHPERMHRRQEVNNTGVLTHPKRPSPRALSCMRADVHHRLNGRSVRDAWTLHLHVCERTARGGLVQPLWHNSADCAREHPTRPMHTKPHMLFDRATLKGGRLSGSGRALPRRKMLLRARRASRDAAMLRLEHWQRLSGRGPHGLLMSTRMFCQCFRSPDISRGRPLLAPLPYT